MTSVNYAPQVLKLVLHSFLYCSFQIKLSGPFFSVTDTELNLRAFFIVWSHNKELRMQTQSQQKTSTVRSRPLLDLNSIGRGCPDLDSESGTRSR